MTSSYPEWRILSELADKPVATPELREWLRSSANLSSFVLTTCLGRLQAWGWLRAMRSVGRQRSVTVYVITEPGLEALQAAKESGYAAVPLELERALGDQPAKEPKANAASRAQAQDSDAPRPPSEPSRLTFTPECQRVLEQLERSNANLFITGRAGTGKSTLLQHFRATTKKQVVVLAPTGVAAVNVGGQTIHSFFRFPPGITLNEVRSRSGNRDLYEQLDTLIIDEISMVRADLFDCIEKFLRLNGPVGGVPFGGVQVVLFGDLYQLPPVVPKDEAHLFKSLLPAPTSSMRGLTPRRTSRRWNSPRSTASAMRRLSPCSTRYAPAPSVMKAAPRSMRRAPARANRQPSRRSN